MLILEGKPEGVADALLLCLNWSVHTSKALHLAHTLEASRITVSLPHFHLHHPTPVSIWLYTKEPLIYRLGGSHITLKFSQSRVWT